MNLFKSLLLVVLAALCAMWITSIMSVPAVYNSVHAVGHRVGMVLPQGFDPGSELRRDQSVRITPVSSSPAVSRPPASQRANPAQSGQADRHRSDRVWLAGLVVGCAVLALGFAVFVRWYNWRGEGDDDLGSRPLHADPVRALLVLLPIGLVMAFVFVGVRIFWTGVDDAFIARSTIIRPDSASIHIAGDTTLSMNSLQMFMLYMAVVLTMVPLMFRLALLALGGEITRSRRDRRDIFSAAQGLMDWIVQKRNWSLDLTLALYVLLTLVLWTAPWSTTIARALWSSPGT
jgi:hypothetical protein